jgi:hypothetical protein
MADDRIAVRHTSPAGIALLDAFFVNRCSAPWIVNNPYR